MTEETWGVNYRSLRDLFQISKERAEAIKYEVGVQMIEIYNEQVRDLLVSDGSNRRYPSSTYFLYLYYIVIIFHYCISEFSENSKKEKQYCTLYFFSCSFP